MMQKGFFAHSSELIMIAFATGILLILFIPIPAAFLDILLISNFSWALTILLLAFYTDKPLSFSTFPALLLISTLFRLALNVSATRLILSNGDAGRVIGAIGQYVIHDNYVMGLVVFLILIIVQYVVVTNGAQRVAEVAARFTLDSMPGKQMSIDADLNMGLISAEEAKHRRAQIEKEANFYGAMDGASKFVKGDAIAGILIMLVDLIGGFAIGMAQKGMNIIDSMHTYSLLTVGDGLVTQIPALTIALATGIIVTRAATDAQLGHEVFKQVATYPKSLIMVCLCLLTLLFVKGIPVLPVLLIFSLFAIGTGYALRHSNHHASPTAQDISLYEQIRIHPIEIHLNEQLFHELKPYESEIMRRIQTCREYLAYDMGFVIPDVSFRPDKKCVYPAYALLIEGTQTSTGQLIMQNSDDALGAFLTDISYTLHNHLDRLLTRAELEILLNQSHIAGLRDELIPNVLSLAQVQHILQHLLQEKVSIRNLRLILETLLDKGKTLPDPLQLTEMIRMRLAATICEKLISNQNRLYVLTITPELEQTLHQSMHNQVLALDPAITERFMNGLHVNISKMINQHKKPVLLCSGIIRRQLKQLTQRLIPNLTILGMNEVPLNIQIELFGVVA